MGSTEIQAIINRDFPPHTHPYRVLEQKIVERLGPDATVLDIGCGRRAPNLMRLKGRARPLIGAYILAFEIRDSELVLINADILDMNMTEIGSVDLFYSRDVMEHLRDIDIVHGEIYRALSKPADRNRRPSPGTRKACAAETGPRGFSRPRG